MEKQNGREREKERESEQPVVASLECIKDSAYTKPRRLLTMNNSIVAAGEVDLIVSSHQVTIDKQKQYPSHAYAIYHRPFYIQSTISTCYFKYSIPQTTAYIVYHLPLRIQYATYSHCICDIPHTIAFSHVLRLSGRDIYCLTLVS